jgi:hypothetical protein
MSTNRYHSQDNHSQNNQSFSCYNDNNSKTKEKYDSRQLKTLIHQSLNF